MEKQNTDNTENIRHYFRTRSLVKILIWTLVFALILKLFFFDAYRIPTSSMEETLLAGDFILVNKASYSLSFPSSVPFFNIKLPDYRIFTFSKPERGDVVVFLFTQNWNENPETENYIKRIIGLPGDTIAIFDNDVFVNGRKILDDKKNLGGREREINAPEKIFSDRTLWDGRNLSPVIIPWKGLTVEINHNNINKISRLINREYEKNVVSVEGTVININGEPARTYTFRQDHYFVLGDNRDVSMDSRYWDTIPENLITGEALLIYWSVIPSMSFLNSVRFERIFKIIN